MSTENMAIYTICNDDFFSGLENLLYSFIKHNPDFQGDFIVAHSKTISPLSLDHREKVSKKYSNIISLRFLEVEESRYRDIVNQIPPQGIRFIPALFIFEIFNLKQYEKIIYVDVDILVTSSFDSIFSSPNELCVFRDTEVPQEHVGYISMAKIADGVSLLQKIKHRYIFIKRVMLVKTFTVSPLQFMVKGFFFVVGKICRVQPHDHDTDVYFNSGCIVVGNKYLDSGVYGDLMLFAEKNSRYMFFPDQDILNAFTREYCDGYYYFNNKKNGIKVKYEDASFSRLEEDNPWFIHYVGKKPWMREDEGDMFYHLFNFSLVGGRKIEVGYKVQESYKKINQVWHDSYAEYKKNSN